MSVLKITATSWIVSAFVIPLKRFQGDRKLQLNVGSGEFVSNRFHMVCKRLSVCSDEFRSGKLRNQLAVDSLPP